MVKFKTISWTRPNLEQFLWQVLYSQVWDNFRANFWLKLGHHVNFMDNLEQPIKSYVFDCMAKIGTISGLFYGQLGPFQKSKPPVRFRPPPTTRTVDGPPCSVILCRLNSHCGPWWSPCSTPTHGNSTARSSCCPWYATQIGPNPAYYAKFG